MAAFYRSIDQSGLHFFHSTQGNPAATFARVLEIVAAGDSTAVRLLYFGSGADTGQHPIASAIVIVVVIVVVFSYLTEI